MGDQEISQPYAKELARQVDELEGENEQLRGLAYDLRALLTGSLSGPEQVKGVLEWADDLIGSEGDVSEQKGSGS